MVLRKCAKFRLGVLATKPTLTAALRIVRGVPTGTDTVVRSERFDELVAYRANAFVALGRLDAWADARCYVVWMNSDIAVAKDIRLHAVVYRFTYATR